MILENHVSTSAEQSREIHSSTSAHTPGPWEVNGTTIETIASPSVVIGRAYDAEDSGGGVESNSEAEANARLIAAAPELLAALRGLVEDYEGAYGGNDEDAPKALTDARAAIAKATGA
jgi:hypothetical protein